MRIILFSAISIFILLSCSETGNQIILTDMVSIHAFEVVDTVIFPQHVPLNVRAEANNECWSHLKVSFTDKDQFSYIVKAYGTYRSSGLCPDNIVTLDTVIFFNPPASGKYKFFIYYDYQTIRTDSVVVK